MTFVAQHAQHKRAIAPTDKRRDIYAVIEYICRLTKRLSIQAGSLAGERGSTCRITCGSLYGVRGSLYGVRGTEPIFIAWVYTGGLLGSLYGVLDTDDAIEYLSHDQIRKHHVNVCLHFSAMGNMYSVLEP